MSNTSKQPEAGKITEATLTQMQERVGVEVPEPRRYHNDYVTQDGSRHFCWGYGDDNPLYCNAEYAKNTRWKGLIAAPGFSYTMGENDVAPLSPEMKKKLKGDPLSGLGAYQAEMNFEWWQPLREGDQCYLRKALVGTKLSEGRMGGKTIHEVRGIFQRNQDGVPVASRRGTFIATERSDKKEGDKKKDDRKSPALPQPYSDDELAVIDACYEAEADIRRGDQTRYWEDVEVAEALPQMVKDRKSVV